MKRILIVLAVATLVASVATMGATVVGTRHDLSATGGTTQRSTNVGEVCGFCHIPHAAYTGTGSGGGTNRLVPLWAHTQTATVAFTLYTSPTGTLNTTTLTQPAGVSRACLSCHDGTIGLGSIVGGVQLVNTAGTARVTPSNSAAVMTGTSMVGTDLSNDHPVSFTYNAALATADGALVDPTTANVASMLFAGQVECGSCHDVHDNTLSPFLRVTMVGSAMCVRCHVK